MGTVASGLLVILLSQTGSTAATCSDHPRLFDLSQEYQAHVRDHIAQQRISVGTHMIRPEEVWKTAGGLIWQGDEIHDVATLRTVTMSVELRCYIDLDNPADLVTHTLKIKMDDDGSLVSVDPSYDVLGFVTLRQCGMEKRNSTPRLTP